MKKLILFMYIILLAIVAACIASPSISKDDQLATIVAETLTAQPVVFTSIPALTFTSVPTVVVNDVVTAGGT